jgi:hypothetical protein
MLKCYSRPWLLIGELPRGFSEAKGTFAEYPADEKIALAGIINCPGCPTLTGPDKLIERIER